MRKTTAENPKIVVPNKSKALLGELDRLTKQFAELTTRLAETASRLKDPSALPSSALMLALSDASKNFSALRESSLELAHSLAIPYEGEPEGPSSIEDLKRLLEKTLSAEERAAEGAGDREGAEHAAEPVDSWLQEPVATDELASAVAALGKTLDIPADPAPPIAQDLPSEVEEFLESVIEEISRTKKASQGFPSGTTVNPAPLVSAPPRREIPMPEASRTGTKEAAAPRQVTPSTSETIVPEPRGQQNLAENHQDQEKYAKKERFYQDSLGFMERTVGDTHPEVADLLGNLALLYYRQKKYADAEAVYQRALWIREKSLGAEHPQVATTLNNLALLYRDQENFAKAQEFWERSLTIVEKAFGPEHPKTALRVANLADLFYLQSKYELAEPLYQRLVAILEKIAKKERPKVTSSLENYLELLRKNRRKQEALQVQALIKTF